MNPIFIPGHFARAGVDDRDMGPGLNLLKTRGCSSLLPMGAQGPNVVSEPCVQGSSLICYLEKEFIMESH